MHQCHLRKRVVAEPVDEPVIGLRSQQLGMSLMGAMTAAVLRRARDGFNLDDHDYRIMEDASKTLRISANAIEFLSSEGKAEYPRIHSFAAARLAAETASIEQEGLTEARSDQESAKYLRKLADELDKIHNSADPKAIVESILPSFSALANLTISSSDLAEDISTPP